MVLEDSTCVYAHTFNSCPPFRLIYDYSVLPVVGSIPLERVLSLIPPLPIPYRCHLQLYHLLQHHPPNHQPPRQAQGNGFQSCVFVLPTAKGSPILSVQTALASPAASRSITVAVGSEGTELLTPNLSVHLPLFHLLPNQHRSPHPQRSQLILHSRLTVSPSSYDSMTQCFGCVMKAFLRQLQNDKQILVKPSWRLKRTRNSNRPSPSLCEVFLQVVPSHQPHLFPTHNRCHQQLQPSPWEDSR